MLKFTLSFEYQTLTRMIKSFTLLFLTIFLAPRCNNLDPKQESVKIIFDTDMGSDCDDVGALALLNVYTGQGKAEILGCIYSSGKIPYGLCHIHI